MSIHEAIPAAVVIVSSVVVILIGQTGRELLPPDDLREAEVAREILKGGDWIVPHLAGRPFVEKPPGFQAVVALTYRFFGGPNATTARFVSAAFALASLAAVFLLGRHTIGMGGSALAVATLAFSMRFCRTAHEVLLDNALTASSAFSLFFTWLALSAATPRRKHLAYAAAGFSLGISFLIKGFVGPALFGAGCLVYLATTKRFDELRHVFRPLPVIAFLIPLLVWVIPFIRHASPALIRSFFIDNTFGRALDGFASNKRPFYYYLINIWPAFAPGSILLPFAIRTVWKKRNLAEGEAAILSLAFSIGPMILLSLSTAKDSVYLLPAYPALALLVAWFIDQNLKNPTYQTRIGGMLVSTLAAFCAAIAMIMTTIMGGKPYVMVITGIVFIWSMIASSRALRHGNFRLAAVSSSALFALTWIFWFTGPIAHYEVSKVSNHRPIKQVIGIANGGPIFLYKPNDGLRGAFGFYRDQAAQELDRPSDLVTKLAEDRKAMAVFLRPQTAKPVPEELNDAAATVNLVIRVGALEKYDDWRNIILIKAYKTGYTHRIPKWSCS